MKAKDILKTAIKLAPILYPVVKQMFASKKGKTAVATRRK